MQYFRIKVIIYSIRSNLLKFLVCIEHTNNQFMIVCILVHDLINFKNCFYQKIRFASFIYLTFQILLYRVTLKLQEGCVTSKLHRGCI